ncbi:hypothetical protein AB0J38_30610 [Streptomyces sp. NPDC050095]|uniref:hypothetical protein n=1 Tax=unclassified Streptomyces TaxID=2593676 RepID=UPI003423B994
MTDVEQLPHEVGEFARHLRELLSRVDQGAGWCGVFWQRDPEGMRACLDGREVPPWDVVESLLQDASATLGPEWAEREGVRARALQNAATRAYDSRPGGDEVINERLGVMAAEQRYAVERQRELTQRLNAATTQQESEAVRLDLAWARDDYERATARIAELRARKSNLGTRGTARPAQGGVQSPTTQQPDSREGEGPQGRGPRKRRPRGSARFAGILQDEPETQDVLPATSAPDAGVGTPRGARFAGTDPAPQRAPVREDPEARQEVPRAVDTLLRLRHEGRTGEAHIVLVGAAHWPAARLPLLATELLRAGLAADWATLLWEVASLPPEGLVAAAEALTAAGRTADGQQVLRQGMGRSPDEIGEAVGRLDDEGRHREARILLAAYVRSRTPEEAARSAQSDPVLLVPLIVEAARAVSDERYWDVVHALRVAGFAA